MNCPHLLVTETRTLPARRLAKRSAPDSELHKLKAERDSLLDLLSRAQAEFENARRRASKEQQEFREYATSGTIKSLLPVVDNLERALRVSGCDGIPAAAELTSNCRLRWGDSR